MGHAHTREYYFDSGDDEIPNDTPRSFKPIFVSYTDKNFDHVSNVGEQFGCCEWSPKRYQESDRTKRLKMRKREDRGLDRNIGTARTRRNYIIEKMKRTAKKILTD